jgi:hypothetical protein
MSAGLLDGSASVMRLAVERRLPGASARRQHRENNGREDENLHGFPVVCGDRVSLTN